MSLSKLKDVFYIAAIGVLGWLVIFGKEEQKKIGYIDLKKVFDGFELKKDLQKKYESQMAGKKKTIDSLGFQLQQLGIELESMTKPDPAKTQTYMQKQKMYMELVKVYNEEDQKVNSQYDSEILTQLNQFVKDYGDEQKYDMILGSMGNGSIMQASPEMDLTNKVIKYINKKYAGKD